MTRKEFLASLGLLGAGITFLGPDVLARANDTIDRLSEFNAKDGRFTRPIKQMKADTLGKQITCIVIGAGNRGRMYSRYAEMFPECLKIVGVSDILESRKNATGDRYNVPAEMRFGHYDEVFACGKKLADMVIIATPDDSHYVPCMKALELGYDVLLEKPVAQSEKECKDIEKMTRKSGRIVGVCHVLRYAPYFVALREAVRSGMIGDVVSIQHQEPIQYAHMAHSYVRGNWRNSKETTPIILAKSCHDLDIIRWLVDKPCKTISADGSLHLFKPENAPAGAPKYCADGCPVEATCPYSALDIYVKRKAHLGVFDLKDRKNEAEILEKLTTTHKSYGRCVYHCDNDQPDHYVANMVFEGGITSSFTMDAFCPRGGRRTRIMGTIGYIEGDMNTFTIYDFRSNKRLVWDGKVLEEGEYKGHGHGGGDYALFRDFLEAVAAHDENKLTSNIEASIESHVMGFRAEKSRLSMKKVKVD